VVLGEGEEGDGLVKGKEGSLGQRSCILLAWVNLLPGVKSEVDN
jgi:hypothetical protein